MPSWMQRTEDKKEEERKIELKPEDMAEALKPHLDKINTDLDSKLNPMIEYFKKQNEREAAAEAARSATAREENRRNLEVNPEDYLNDPDAAMNKKLTPVLQQNAALAALIMRKETLEKMEYYDDPDFKSAVDQLIESQPLTSRSNTSVIMNCYKSVHYDKRKEIAEGKIKSQLSGGERGGTGGHSGDSGAKDEDKFKLSNEERAYARKFGVSEEQWAKQKRELEYV